MKKPILIVTLAALVIIGAAAFLIPKFSGGAAKTQAGECVGVDNHTEDRADVAGLGCANDKASFKVGKVLTDAKATCPDTGDEYTQIVPSTGGGKLCLLPNFVEGGCYQLRDDGESWGKSTCAGEETIKVAKVVAATGLEAECPESEDVLDMTFPEPPVTYCLNPVKR